jgi:membrane protease YdiL (CAAX protease family)
VALTGRLAGWLWLVGVVSALAWIGNLAAGSAPKNAVYKYSTGISELVLFALILGVVLWLARGLPKRDAFALRRPRSWGGAVAVGFGIFVTIWIVAVALEPVLHPGREQGLTPSRWEPAHAGAFALNLFALAIVGPVVEELTFRGLGFRLFERYGQAVAVIAIGVAFAFWHGLLDALPVLFVFGAGLAYLRARTGSVYPGMVLHAAFNTLALAVAVTV